MQDNKVALISGGSQGIGAAIGVALATAGFDLVINYRSHRDEAEKLAEQIKSLGRSAHIVQADVCDPEQIKRLAASAQQRFGRVDVLVNNAGITWDGFFKKMTPEQWHTVLKTNLDSAYYLTHAIVPLMLEQQWGRIINISSFVAQKGNLGQTNYAASKAALIGFSKSLALELARHNITVNAVCPGFIATEMVNKIREDIQEKLRNQVPMHRFGRPEEVANLVRFLATEGDYITGQQLNINGGIYM